MTLTPVKRLLNFATHRIFNLPVLVMMPHSRCNCRCVMCDIWKANNEKREISLELLRMHVTDLKKLGVREVVFSGGEALMHNNLWALAKLLRDEKISVTLLSTGLLLEKHADDIHRFINRVIVSLDGSEAVHNEIRQIPNAFERLTKGVQRVKEIDKHFPITARCVLQKKNFRDYVSIVRAAKSIGLDQISFLAADVSSAAFNRQMQDHAPSDIVLELNETEEFEQILRNSFSALAGEYDSRFIAEPQWKLLDIVKYYRALNRATDFPPVRCNAPWVSAVIESDGSVRPCFFHKSFGNINELQLSEILNSDSAVKFRQQLDIHNDPICKRCVCSLRLGLTAMT